MECSNLQTGDQNVAVPSFTVSQVTVSVSLSMAQELRLVLIQPKKTCFDMTEFEEWWLKRKKQNKQGEASVDGIKWYRTIPLQTIDY